MYIHEYEQLKEQEDTYMYHHKVVQENSNRDMQLTPGFTFNSQLNNIQVCSLYLVCIFYRLLTHK